MPGLPISCNNTVSPNQEDFSSTENMTKSTASKHFSKNSVQGIGEGDIDVDIEGARP